LIDLLATTIQQGNQLTILKVERYKIKREKTNQFPLFPKPFWSLSAISAYYLNSMNFSFGVGSK
jgi:hypothetical protein